MPAVSTLCYGTSEGLRGAAGQFGAAKRDLVRYAKRLSAMVFLCWNLNNRPLEALVAALVGANRVDVVILSECAVSVGGVRVLKRIREKPVPRTAP